MRIVVFPWGLQLRQAPYDCMQLEVLHSFQVMVPDLVYYAVGSGEGFGAYAGHYSNCRSYRCTYAEYRNCARSYCCQSL